MSLSENNAQTLEISSLADSDIEVDATGWSTMYPAWIRFKVHDLLHLDENGKLSSFQMNALLASIYSACFLTPDLNDRMHSLQSLIVLGNASLPTRSGHLLDLLKIRLAPILHHNSRYKLIKVGPSKYRVLATLKRKWVLRDDDPVHLFRSRTLRSASDGTFTVNDVNLVIEHIYDECAPTQLSLLC